MNNAEVNYYGIRFRLLRLNQFQVTGSQAKTLKQRSRAWPAAEYCWLLLLKFEGLCLPSSKTLAKIGLLYACALFMRKWRLLCGLSFLYLKRKIFDPTDAIFHAVWGLIILLTWCYCLSKKTLGSIQFSSVWNHDRVGSRVPLTTFASRCVIV